MAREKITGWLRHAAGGLREDLLRAPVLPMPPMAGPRLLRRLPHVFFGALALVLLTSAVQFQDAYGVASGPATVLGLGHSAAVALGLYRPMLGWWLSIAVFVAGAAATAPPADPSAVWPWPVAGLFAHTAVQLLLSLRVPARVTAQTLSAALLLTVAINARGPGGEYSDSVVFAAALFSLAAVIGVSMHRAREARQQLRAQETLTAEERARRTLLEERSRIARELHDVVAHHMSVISIQAEAAPYRVQDPPEELTRSFTVIRSNALEALAELRRVLGVLRSEEHGGRPSDGTPDAPQPSLDRLDDLVANVRTAGLDVRTNVTGEPRLLPPGVELSVYRIVQEALSNALRHAAGSRVRVEIAHGPDGIRVSVANTAPRQPPEPSPGAGHGLLGMRERATMLGGELAAGPGPDGGFQVTAFLPVHQEAADHPDAHAPPAGARNADPRNPEGERE
ncbi:sensor histidine kinase [Streptomyces sp. N2-109]|uniref:histidine kinase n=1 Tax=Streptomyces gossypii TaxID=2883101 RepID=A0ABT2JPD7_9ACTN|nr:sensor histidine kinase [Streptomyces gossypii]MCT2589731.1 sensor histidine kinase [Streptomyces gossypii]